MDAVLVEYHQHVGVNPGKLQDSGWLVGVCFDLHIKDSDWLTYSWIN